MDSGHKSHAKRQEKALDHQGSGARLLAAIRCMESYIEGAESANRYRHQYTAWGLPIVAVTFTLAGAAGMFVFESAWSTWVSVGMGFAVGALTHLAMPIFLNIVARVSGEHRISAMGLFVVTNEWGSLLGAAPGGLILAKGATVRWGFAC